MKILLSIILLFLSPMVFSAGTSNNNPNDDTSSLTKDFKEAKKLIYKKDYDKALKILLSLEPVSYTHLTLPTILLV